VDVRAQARAGREVRLRSRNDLSLNQRYPELAAALERQDHAEFAIDGEVVAFEGSRTSFARLAQRGHHWVPVWLYVFDLVWVSGYDVRELPLRVRKSLLRATLRFDRPVRFTAHRNREGEAYFEEACRRGWEGLIAKRIDSPYRPGRSRDWLKFKCEQGQELVIGGFTAPRGSREEFGALLLGFYRGGELRYAGKVGTGFDRATLHELAARLRRLRRGTPPFDSVPREAARGATWVEPELVAQVSFTEWTADGRLRHPRFLGLREDKSAAEVVREDWR